MRDAFKDGIKPEQIQLHFNDGVHFMPAKLTILIKQGS